MSARLKRSKDGCETCKSRKVKCNEQRPNCSECTRLRLSCRWSQRKRVPIKDIRRGYGPVKSRDPTWAPSPILPTPSESSSAGDGRIAENSTSSSSPQPEWDNLISDMASESDDWWQGLGVDIESMTFVTSDDVIDFDSPRFLGSTQDFGDLGQLLTNNAVGNRRIINSIPAIFPNASLSSYHVALPNSLTLSSDKHEALRHYQTTYSLYRTTKDPNWSTHKVLLNLGSQDAMIMNLLLAVAINDYSLRSGQCSQSHEAEHHFQTGAQLLIGTMKTGAETDSVIMMAAFFFIYLYMSKRESTGSQRLTQLSLRVSDYVSSQDLIARCLSPLPLQSQAQTRMASSSQNRSLLARLIMWTLDEDVKCSFQGTGGHLARYLAKRSAQTKDIYDASRNALGDHWGTEYPHSQMIDDDQNSTVLEFLWAMMPLWQDINDLPQESAAGLSHLDSRIEQKFIYLEERYSSVFRHSSEPTKPRSRILVNADYDVVLFNALRVYYFRSTVTDLTAETPPDIQLSVKTILTIIQRTFRPQSTELHDRLQWPLFLVGIETDDPIYREWVFSRLTSNRVAAALQRTLDAQAFTGKRLRMAEIRDFFYNTADLSLPPSSSAFLVDNV